MSVWGQVNSLTTRLPCALNQRASISAAAGKLTTHTAATKNRTGYRRVIVWPQHAQLMSNLCGANT